MQIQSENIDGIEIVFNYSKDGDSIIAGFKKNPNLVVAKNREEALKKMREIEGG